MLQQHLIYISEVSKKRSKEEGALALKAFLNKVAHDQSFHPTREYEQWYSYFRRGLIREVCVYKEGHYLQILGCQ